MDAAIDGFEIENISFVVVDDIKVFSLAILYWYTISIILHKRIL